MMWNKVYEVGLINDPDGVLIKLMNFQTELTHFMYPDWEMPDESASRARATTARGKARVRRAGRRRRQRRRRREVRPVTRAAPPCV